MGRPSTIRGNQRNFLAARSQLHGKPVTARLSPNALGYRWSPIFVLLTWLPMAKVRRWFPFWTILFIVITRVGRIIQNIGGIGNLTAIPAAAPLDKIVAFDTGPGNMVMDAVTDRLFGKPYDRDGLIAASGSVRKNVLKEILRAPFFQRKPPKTAGREEFGREFIQDFIRRCGKANKHDVVATATALTAHSIRNAITRFVTQKQDLYRDFIVSGGGTQNPTLMAMLVNELKPLGLRLRFSDEFGIPSEAKEAVAFALLAYQTWNRQPSNIISATGAKRLAILGKISYV